MERRLRGVGPLWNLVGSRASPVSRFAAAEAGGQWSVDYKALRLHGAVGQWSVACEASRDH